MDTNKALTVGSTAGLVLLNLAALSVQTTIAAVALAGVIALYLRGRRFDDVELFIFILAELSPISLHASLPTALAYQALSVVLLVALCVPLDRLNGLATDKKVVLTMVSIAVIPLALLAIMLYTRALRYSANQLLSVSTLALLGMVGLILVVLQRDRSPVDGVEF